MIDLHGDALAAGVLDQIGRLFNRFGTSNSERCVLVVRPVVDIVPFYAALDCFDFAPIQNLHK
jgi:hypothetical protein